ncbi:MAG: hypothetical protein QHH18_00705 [Candidatus Bathyarchaeota archaeon]|jgi:hypothetical protein|nr:hypothetical protein [Candidatus Bathyarchaeota archaeon A05DMB-5]MDH7557114.1 hypothetical protein [Candidatus Bathyarchaeota archaeon]
MTALFLVFFRAKPIYAASHGSEEYQDDKSYVYVRYFPIVPYDSNYPTTCEEFAVTFTCKQNDWWKLLPPWHVVPDRFYIFIWYLDTCGNSDYANFERVHPISVSQYGLQASFTLRFMYKVLTLGITLSGEDASFEKSTAHEYMGDWLYLGNFLVDYHDSPLWGAAQTDGTLSISIENGVAQYHLGHHVLIELEFLLIWADGTQVSVIFIIGDDFPDTDCWLTVEQGNTQFSLTSGGGGGCPTLFVWNGTSYAEEGVLDIHAESDITVQHTIENSLALENGVYRLQLRELDEFTSHIDQVKLYAVDYQGEWHLCPLIYAYHSELGYVTTKLMLDDQKRVDLTPTQTIDLKFLPSIPSTQTVHFIFEINGYNMKWPGEP